MAFGHTGLIGNLWILAVTALGVSTIAGVAAAQSPQQEAPPFDSSNVVPSWVNRIPMPIQPKELPSEDDPALCEDKPGGLRDDFDTLPRQFARRDDDAVLFGLGYRRPGRMGGHFDADIGARLRWPLEPYVKGTYRLGVPFGDRNLLRLDETIFWRAGEGFGVTTRFDLERLLAEDFLVRWTSSGAFTGETEGVRWLSSLTLYQNLGGGHALAYEAGISGETDREVTIADYGLRVIYRRRIYLDWLFLELRSSITWPRETLIERREPNWGAGIALEMLFGERTER